MKQSPDGLLDRMSKTLGRQSSQRWWDLSKQVQRAALLGDPSDVLGKLAVAAETEKGSPLDPAFRLWRADALIRSGRDREAVSAYDDALSTADSAPAFERVDFVREALRHRAGALGRLGDVDRAVESWRELEERGEKGALYHAGVLAERAGRFEQATSLYREIAQQERTPDADDEAQCALRAAERLANPDGVFMPSELGIAHAVEEALTRHDAAALRRLVSATHFAAGPGGGHFRFETEDLLDRLADDLHRSRPRRMHARLLGTGRKRYLLTSGWEGEWFRNVVGFYFAHSGRGWSWEGLVVNAPAEPWFERWEPTEKSTNQPLPFGLLAPWPAGRHFMAGGLPLFAVQSAAIATALLVPLFGAGIAAALAFGYSLSDCGYGLRGFYYNQGPTHSGTDAFAIDFTAYRRGVPFDNVAGGTRVLAAAPGIVRFVRNNISSGDSSAANEVRIDHDDPATSMPRFVSRYLHMAGPGLIPVSAGMAAPVGARLGVMNDTGTSVLDHLHFSIHDSAAGPGIGPSVRPSPMEGRTLGDGSSGACIRSSNEERIALPPGCADVAGEIVRGLFGRD
ncbi:MAG TPA: M23 family metallopeptidase [Longimicrobiales bacterium]|nr:M23 family metallopeptidase [Longimicrobiales bacterium]